LELRFTVWQFVRLMVHIEENATPPKQLKSLHVAWSDVWQPLDAELSELAERDFDAFSDLMMDQDVVIEDATNEQAAVAQQAVNEIMATMDRAIEEGGRTETTHENSEHIQNLKFERRELRQLSRKLGRIE